MQSKIEHNNYNKTQLNNVCISQPTYLPWIGYFDKILKSDTFVLYDTAQFVRRGKAYHNRNKIRTPNSWQWLSIPVNVKEKEIISNVKINNNLPWQKEHWKSIEYNYGKSNFFPEYKKIFENIYIEKWDGLSEFNISIIKTIINILNIKTKIIKASDFGESGLNATDDLIWLCKKTNATTYISGPFGKEYIEKEKFTKEKIILKFQEFEHPVYTQAFQGFEPYMSIIDLLFNHGADKTIDILKNGHI